MLLRDQIQNEIESDLFVTRFYYIFHFIGRCFYDSVNKFYGFEEEEEREENINWKLHHIHNNNVIHWNLVGYFPFSICNKYVHCNRIK